MKYERMATVVEAFQYVGDIYAAQAFCLSHIDTNADQSHRPPSVRRVIREKVVSSDVQIWVEKSQAYCTIQLGDYIVAEADGIGVYPHHQAGFEKMHRQLGDQDASAET